MISFSFKKLINFSVILFFSFSLFLLLPLFIENTVSAQTCEAPFVDDPDGGACILPTDIENRNNQTKALDSGATLNTSMTPEEACAYLKDVNSGKYLNCVQAETAKTLPPSAFDPLEETASCSSLNGFFKNWGACIARGFGYAILTILTFLVSFAGQIFDFAVKFSLFEMGTLIGQSNNGINIAWSTIRDLGNILFIFMLLWVSITNILQIGDAKKFIPTLILAALLVNFSLFFTKVIIDTSNIVAVQFYSSITNNGAVGISGAFMEKFDAETMFSGKEVAGTAWGVTTQMWATAVMVFIMFFIFLQASFLFIARTAVLIFLLPFSPIMFLGSILPKLKEYTDKWWKELICNSLSAPIYFLLIWVSLQILSSVNVVKSGKGINDALSGMTATGDLSPTSVTVIFSYFLVCFFLIASYKVAKCDGLSGTITSGLMTVAGAVVGGVGGFAGKQILGRGAAALAGSENFKGWASNSKVGRLALQTTEGVAKSSFDVRAAGEIPLVGGMASKLAGIADVKLDLGKKPENLKDGYRGDLKRGEEALGKERVEMAKLLEAKKVKLTTKEINSIDLTDAEKAGKSSEEVNKLRAEKLKVAEVDKQRTTTQERQKEYFDQLKTGKGEIIPQSLKIGDTGGTKKAEKEIDQKYKADREIAGLEETIKELMGSHGSVKDAIDNFTKQAATISVELEDLGKGADKDARAKLILEREMAKTNARTLQNYINKLDLIRDRESKKKDDGGSEKKK
ncbi:MAG: Uncharacterized protein LiPW30_204 [Parcubacteria group bacterium LiPW_30]|nr:MAG: Uncharacterized protein LiPW30_204 [Parcubacteria group bacterium LiPW_30]